MGKIEYSKEFLQISKQLKLSEEEKKAGWTGALDKSGEMTQVLVFEKDKKFFALTNKGAQALNGAADINAAKTMVRQAITAKTSKDFGGLNFSDEAMASMSKTREGGASEKPAGEGETPVDPNAGKTPTGNTPEGTSTVDRDTKLAAILKEFPANAAQNVTVKKGDGSDAAFVVGTKDGGKTYIAMDANGQSVPLQTTPDIKNLLNANKAVLKAAIDKGFGSSIKTVASTSPDSNMDDTRLNAWSKLAADTAAYTPVPVKDNSNKDGLVYLHNSGAADKPSWEIVDFNGNKSSFTPTSADQARITQEIQASVKANNLTPGPTSTAADKTPSQNTAPGATTAPAVNTPAPAKPNSTVGDSNTSNPDGTPV